MGILRNGRRSVAVIGPRLRTWRRRRGNWSRTKRMGYLLRPKNLCIEIEMLNVRRAGEEVAVVVVEGGEEFIRTILTLLLRVVSRELRKPQAVEKQVRKEYRQERRI